MFTAGWFSQRAAWHAAVAARLLALGELEEAQEWERRAKNDATVAADLADGARVVLEGAP